MENYNAVKKISRGDLIDEIVDDFGGAYSPEIVQDILQALESTILSHLRSATAKQSIAIKLFKGLVLSSRVNAERIVNLNGKTYIQSERLTSHAKYSRYFIRNILNQNKD